MDRFALPGPALFRVLRYDKNHSAHRAVAQSRWFLDAFEEKREVPARASIIAVLAYLREQMDASIPREVAGRLLHAIIVNDLRIRIGEVAFKADYIPALIAKQLRNADLENAVNFCKENGLVTDGPGGLRLLSSNLKWE